MKNTSKQYFVSTSEITPAIKGRYGVYAQRNGLNYSERELRKLGFELRTLTQEEANATIDEMKVAREQARANRRAIELERRATQVELCLAGEPIAIGEGNDLWLHVTNLTGNHREAYTGCGKATAYITDSKIIAWHYGDERPANAPACDYVQLCEVSCSQILF